jgi:hypothetical protein
MKKHTTKTIILLSAILTMTGTALNYAPPTLSQLEKNQVSWAGVNQTIPNLMALMKIGNNIVPVSLDSPQAVVYNNDIFYANAVVGNDWVYYAKDGVTEIYWDTIERVWRNGTEELISGVSVYKPALVTGSTPELAPK